MALQCGAAKRVARRGIMDYWDVLTEVAELCAR